MTPTIKRFLWKPYNIKYRKKYKIQKSEADYGFSAPLNYSVFIWVDSMELLNNSNSSERDERIACLLR